MAEAQAQEVVGPSPDSPAIEGNSNAEAQNETTRAREFSLPIRIVEDPVNAEAAEDAAQRERDDLAAQQSMAESTERIVIVSWWQLSLATAGTVLVFGSLLLAFYSTMIARRAVAISENTARRQLRAYLAVEASGKCHLESGQPIRADFKVRNVGLTPAHQVTIRHGSCIRGPEWQGPEWKGLRPDEKGAPRVLLMPTASYGFTVDSSDPAQGWTPDSQNVVNVNSGLQRVFLFGQVDYIDSITLEPRYTRFVYEIGPNALRRGNIQLAAFGNEAT